MITAAGFNPRNRVVCYARVTDLERRFRPARASLRVFIPSGDLCWLVGDRGDDTGRALKWGHCISLCCFFYPETSAPARAASSWPRRSA